MLKMEIFYGKSFLDKSFFSGYVFQKILKCYLFLLLYSKINHTQPYKFIFSFVCLFVFRYFALIQCQINLEKIKNFELKTCVLKT